MPRIKHGHPRVIVRSRWVCQYASRLVLSSPGGSLGTVRRRVGDGVAGWVRVTFPTCRPRQAEAETEAEAADGPSRRRRCRVRAGRR